MRIAGINMSHGLTGKKLHDTSPEALRAESWNLHNRIPSIAEVHEHIRQSVKTADIETRNSSMARSRMIWST
jgi:arginase family enzyme